MSDFFPVSRESQRTYIETESTNTDKYVNKLTAYKKDDICYVNGYIQFAQAQTYTSASNPINLVRGLPAVEAPNSSGIVVFPVIEQGTRKMVSGRVQSGNVGLYIGAGDSVTFDVGSILLMNFSYPIAT